MGFGSDVIEMVKYVFPEDLAADLGHKELWQVQSLAPTIQMKRGVEPPMMVCSTTYFRTDREAWSAIKHDAFAPWVSDQKLSDEEVQVIGQKARAYAKQRAVAEVPTAKASA